MTPTKHDLELAWGPLEHVVRRNELIHACMDLHASGRLSELTAKLTAIDALRFRIRESGMEDCSNHEVSYAVYRAVLGEPDWTRLHALILSLASKHARLALAKESAPKPAHVVWPKPRPIGEAPKDGSMVLICVPGCDPQWTIGVFDPRQCWIDRLAPSAAAVVKPTHFLPLPPSPEVK